MKTQLTILALLAAALTCVSHAQTNLDQEVGRQDLGELDKLVTPKIRPLVVLKQTEIKGRVFYMAVEGDEDETEAPAANIGIRLWDDESSDLMYETFADTNGVYMLPNLDVGVYKLAVGRLLVELRVEDALPGTGDKRNIPKTLLVFIPRSLRE